MQQPVPTLELSILWTGKTSKREEPTLREVRRRHTSGRGKSQGKGLKPVPFSFLSKGESGATSRVRWTTDRSHCDRL